MISSKKIDKIYETVQIEEIIEDFVSLKKRGVNLLGLCPFHNEKTPSFTVSPAKGIFKCFGCGKGGNAIHFLMEHENYSYPEALKHVANKYGIEIEEEDLSPEQQEKDKERASLYIVNEFAKRFFQEQLLNTGEGKSVGFQYFQDRGYDEEIINKFDLGYAPRSGNAFKSAALRAGHEQDRIKALGLISDRGNDFFRERVMFTIHNLSGKPIAFAGRMLGSNKKAPKYINSPETEIYVKSDILYGIFQARTAIRREDNCYLVEGYTDVITLHQHGIENVVAVSGTSLTPGQTRLIKRFTANTTLIFDGDAAGIKAANRSIDLLLEAEVNVKVVILDPEDDPDSAIKRLGKEDFENYLKTNSQDFLEFKIAHYFPKGNQDPFEKSKAIKELVKTLALINDQLSRSLFVSKTAEMLQVEEAVIINEVNKILRSKIWQEKGKRKKDRERERQEDTTFEIQVKQEEEKLGSPDYHQELALLQLILKYGNETMSNGLSVAQYCFNNIQDKDLPGINDPQINNLLDKISARTSGPSKLNIQSLISESDPQDAQLIVSLISDEFEYSENWEKRWNILLQNQKPPEENYESDAEHIVISLKLRKVRKLSADWAEKIKGIKDNEELDDFLEFYKELKKVESELAEKLRTIIYG
ncbi:MAG: DNA primase [Saprospirales bacterium]|nr:MAG: DNA primase [Saprospirales bacterium]